MMRYGEQVDARQTAEIRTKVGAGLLETGRGAAECALTQTVHLADSALLEW
jgi:hypothetical protein